MAEGSLPAGRGLPLLPHSRTWPLGLASTVHAVPGAPLGPVQVQNPARCPHVVSSGTCRPPGWPHGGSRAVRLHGVHLSVAGGAALPGVLWREGHDGASWGSVPAGCGFCPQAWTSRSHSQVWPQLGGRGVSVQAARVVTPQDSSGAYTHMEARPE